MVLEVEIFFKNFLPKLVCVLSNNFQNIRDDEATPDSHRMQRHWTAFNELMHKAITLFKKKKKRKVE